MSKIKAKLTPLTDPFSLLLRNVKVVRRERKWKLKLKNHVIVPRLLSNLHLIISVSSCRKPRNLQQKQKGRSAQNAQNTMMANLQEP